ncbi:MarR family EPS-associated transcriptional regulator [Gammaproteobacteria bacterium]|nr:MarR family EPS-associated transcriptional regulator [Gammaproteobacteria bacterium]
MTSRQTQLRDHNRLQVMRILEDTPDLTQRELAEMLGMSLGGINFCLNALIEKGFVKVTNFQKSKNKFGYVYLLTPRGIAEKASLTRGFLQKKMNEYVELRDEIEALKAEASKISEA